MRRISFRIFPILFLLSLTACGGGGGGGVDPTTNPDGTPTGDTATITLESSSGGNRTATTTGTTKTLTEKVDSTTTTGYEPSVCASYSGGDLKVYLLVDDQGVDMGLNKDYATELRMTATISGVGTKDIKTLTLGGTDNSTDGGKWSGGYTEACPNTATSDASITVTQWASNDGDQFTGTFSLNVRASGIGGCDPSDTAKFTGTFMATRKSSACK